MRLAATIPVLAFVTLAACEPVPMEPEATVVDALVGQTLVAENGTVFLFNADGTVGGTFRDEDIVGTYTADAKQVCSTYTAPQQLDGLELCSVPVIEDGMVSFNREDGSTSGPYKIGG